MKDLHFEIRRGPLEALLLKHLKFFATGLYSTEDVRKLCWNKGLKLEKSQFGLILRNPVYIGKIYVPASGNEEGCLVNGLHQALASEKIQQVWHQPFDPYGYLLPNSTLGRETKNAWFDISWKIDFSRWKVLNRRNEPSFVSYHSENK